MRYTVAWGLALVSVLAFEGISSARTTTLPGPAGVQGAEDERPYAVAMLHDSAPARPAVLAEVSRPGGFDDLARIYLCHISHHPRDGLRPEQHACPLFIAATSKPAILGIALAQGST
jgi:hypothetical protein